jgi:hypothetical protein
MLKDKKFRVPRIWSNRELEKFAHLFSGKGVNVSGWKDVDKEGKKYRDYFSNISEYWITNYKSEARGFQGNQENEIFLDLEEDLDESMYCKFDVVFNHTVLEHIFDVNKAFENLCKLSNDIVIVVVPFLQEQHAEYGDYWRFTPLAVEKLFQKLFPGCNSYLENYYQKDYDMYNVDGYYIGDKVLFDNKEFEVVGIDIKNEREGSDILLNSSNI